jgi:peptidyl-prolyl cis-trans isomerase SurA
MKRFFFTVLMTTFLSVSVGAGAQNAPSAAPAPAPLPPAATPTAPTSSAPIETLDRIAFVVNNEAVPLSELHKQEKAVAARMVAAKVTPPPPKELARQVTERMIGEKALMQHARQSGIRVDDTMVQRAIQQVAADNKTDVAGLQKLVAREGLSFDEYREEIRKQMTFQRMRERQIDNQIVVTDAEVDNFLKIAQAQAGTETEYNVQHILIAVPDQATPDVIDQRLKRANDALNRLKKGEAFSTIAASMSDAPDALSGGDLGWRTLARMPTIFAQQISEMGKGQLSPIIRSPAGFHILWLNGIRDRNAPTVIQQTHARHILARVNETESEEEAHQKMMRAQQRIKDGESFEKVARLMSEDMSASKGGDLGWLSPGDTVPDFERAMNALPVGGTSDIIRSPFGWHIIKVDERRQQDVTQERRRAQARMALMQRKAEEMFDSLARQIRDQAYVEYKTDEQ